MLSPTLTLLMTGMFAFGFGTGAQAQTTPQWYDACAGQTSLKICMQATHGQFAIMGTNGCWLSTGDTDAAIAPGSVVTGKVQCTAQDFTRLTYAEMWVPDYTKAGATLTPMMTVVERGASQTKSMHMKYDNAQNFSFGVNPKGVSVAWGFETPIGVNLGGKNWSYPMAKAGDITTTKGESRVTEDYFVTMMFPRHTGQSGPVQAKLAGDHDTWMDHRTAPVSVRDTRMPVTFQMLQEDVYGKTLTPYEVLRQSIFMTQAESTSVHSTVSGFSSTLILPSNYGQAVVNRSLIRKGSKPRYLEITSGAFGVGLNRPSEMRHLDGDGLFRPNFLSKQIQNPPKGLFEGSDTYGDIGLGAAPGGGWIVLEPIAGGQVRLYGLKREADSRSHAPDTPGARAARQGFTLTALCETTLNGRALGACAAGQSGTLFGLAYITR